MESVLFYDLQKMNGIEPYKIIASSDEVKLKIKDFFRKNKKGFFLLTEGEQLIGSVLAVGDTIHC